MRFDVRKKYDKKMDKECILLCDVINSIPGLKTIESCCGHNENSFNIWFYIRDEQKVHNLNLIGRVFDQRYGGISGWSCTLVNGDIPNHAITFLISSGSIVGELAYEQSLQIANKVIEHCNHKESFHIELNALKVFPDFTSSGIWRHNTGTMVDFDELPISKELAKDFDKWIIQFDESTSKRTFLILKSKEEIINKKGLSLAKRLKMELPTYEIYYREELKDYYKAKTIQITL